MTGTDILVIGHIENPSMTVLDERIRRTGRTYQLVRPVLGDKLPEPADVSALVVLGGPMSAWDTDQYPELADETRLLAEAHRRGVPILAICLGSHLLAVALGGEAIPGPDGLEYGLINVVAVPAADSDSGVEDDGSDVPLEGVHFSFHSDTMTLPKAARRLASTERYLQAWRSGNALAVQFHPELDAKGIDEMLAIEEDKLARFGVDVPALRGAVAALDGEQDEPTPGKQLIDAWLERLRPGH